MPRKKPQQPEQPNDVAAKPISLPKLERKTALEKAHVEKDLSGVDLSEVDFSGCDLRTVKFTGSNLTGAKFNKAILQGCDFKGASFDADAFNNADTRWAVWE